MSRRIYLLLTTCLLLALPLLAACGQNAAGNGSNAGPQGSGSNEATKQATPAITPVGTVTAITTLKPGTGGPVTLSLAGSSYKAADIITVTLNNKGSGGIEFADHNTDCKVVVLQQQVAGSWQTMRPCKTMIATRLHSLATGENLAIQIGSPNHQWQPGHYRFGLTYRSSRSGWITIYSQEFIVA